MPRCSITFSEGSRSWKRIIETVRHCPVHFVPQAEGTPSQCCQLKWLREKSTHESMKCCFGRLRRLNKRHVSNLFCGMLPELKPFPLSFAWGKMEDILDLLIGGKLQKVSVLEEISVQMNSSEPPKARSARGAAWWKRVPLLYGDGLGALSHWR
jgi:hypothetical protein